MMSTKATGDSQNGAGSAVETGVVSEGTESATIVATVLENTVLENTAVRNAVSDDAALEGTEPTAWDTAAPAAWVAPEQTTSDAKSSAADEAEIGDPVVDDAAADDGPTGESVGDVEAAVTDPDGAGIDEPLSGNTEYALAEPAKADVDEPDENSESVRSEVRDGDDPDGDAGTYEEFDGEYDEEYSAESPEEYGDEYAEYQAENGEYQAENGEYATEDEYAAADAEPRRTRRWPRLLLALGFVVLGAGIVGGAYGIVGRATHNFKQPPPVVTYTQSKVFSLKTGECFDPNGQSYTLISCNSPHVAEVFATFQLTGTKWPGDTVLDAAARSGCATRLTGYINPQLALNLNSAYVYPDSVAWQGGTKTVICEVRAASGDITGSVQGASATAS